MNKRNGNHGNAALESRENSFLHNSAFICSRFDIAKCFLWGRRKRPQEWKDSQENRKQNRKQFEREWSSVCVWNR